MIVSNVQFIFNTIEQNELVISSPPASLEQF